MEELKYKIQQVEEEFLDQLYKYCKNLFANRNLISHDHTHHMRVWEYAKTILYALNKTYDISYGTIESCIISSFFHDTGLTITTDENHGKESKRICIKYFEDYKIKKPENFEEILYAIESHDDKEYELANYDPNSVLSIISTADDLDAFGNIGTIRYTEIYLLREISINELPKLVIKNLDKRFLNFEKTYKRFPDLYVKHKSRYLITKIFFEDLLKEIT